MNSEGLESLVRVLGEHARVYLPLRRVFVCLAVFIQIYAEIPQLLHFILGSQASSTFLSASDARPDCPSVARTDD